MPSTTPSKTQGRRVFEFDAQYLFLVPELAEQLHGDAVLMRAPVVLDLPALTQACRSRVLAEAVASEAGFEPRDDGRLFFADEGRFRNRAPRVLSVGHDWVTRALDEVVAWFRDW